MNDWNKNFISKVEQMREAQKRYFKTRDNETLIKAKQLEAEVEDLIVISRMPSDIPADN